MKYIFPIFFLLLVVGCKTEKGSESADNVDSAKAELEAKPKLKAVEVSKDYELNLKADEVWNSVSVWGDLSEAVPDLVSASLVEGEGVGTKRTLTLADGSGQLIEEITSLDHENRIIQYKVLQTPLPVQNYKAIMFVDTLPDSRSKLRWGSSFKVLEEDEEKMKETILGIYDAIVASLKS